MEFNFHFDEKVVVWIRTRFEIKAETKEEAIKQAIEMASDATIGFDDFENTNMSYTETLYETMLPLKEGTYKELFLENTLIWEDWEDYEDEENTTD